MQLSIISTLYQSEAYVEEFCRRIATAAKALTGDYEIILVDDGSPDKSLEWALKCQKINPKIQIIELSRNFGHHHAMMTGLASAGGELQLLIDCDLEEQPEWLEQFHAELVASGADVVFGVEAKRQGTWIKQATGKFFYFAFNFLSETKLQSNLLTIRLMRLNYVRSLLQYNEREICIAGLWALAGFTQVPVTVKKIRRTQSSYTWAKSLGYFINGITSFSNRPLFYILYSGLIVFAGAIVLTAYHLWKLYAVPEANAVWWLFFSSVWLMGGMLLTAMGVLGIYLSKTYMEVKQRPNSIVRKIYFGDATLGVGSAYVEN
jgi:putative glycosyltransferase